MTVRGRARAAAPVCRSILELPDDMIWEILVLLPPPDVLRCRAVRRSWRAWTSTGQFTLEHHRRQPSLPLIRFDPEDDQRLAVLRDVETTDAENEVRPSAILRHADPAARRDLFVYGSCAGLLLVNSTLHDTDFFYLCNPATRQCVALKQNLDGYVTGDGSWINITVVGFYRHPCGEYRVLYWVRNQSREEPRDEFEEMIDSTDPEPRSTDPAHVYKCLDDHGKLATYYVLPIGSGEPARFIGAPAAATSPASVVEKCGIGLPGPNTAVPYYRGEPPVEYRGSLHWENGWIDGNSNSAFLVAFDTESETFRSVSRPVLSIQTSLIEMDDGLGLCSIKDDGFLIDFWALEDYKAERWEFKYRINLAKVVAALPIDDLASRFREAKVVLNGCDEVLIELDGCGMFLCDIDGNGRFLRDEGYMTIIRYWHKESILPLPVPDMHGDDNEQLMPFLLGC